MDTMAHDAYAIRLSDIVTIAQDMPYAHMAMIQPIMTGAHSDLPGDNVDRAVAELEYTVTLEQLTAIRDVLAFKHYRGPFRVYRMGARGGWKPLKLA